MVIHRALSLFLLLSFITHLFAALTDNLLANVISTRQGPLEQLYYGSSILTNTAPLVGGVGLGSVVLASKSPGSKSVLLGERAIPLSCVVIHTLNFDEFGQAASIEHVMSSLLDRFYDFESDNTYPGETAFCVKFSLGDKKRYGRLFFMKSKNVYFGYESHGEMHKVALVKAIIFDRRGSVSVILIEGWQEDGGNQARAKSDMLGK